MNAIGFIPAKRPRRPKPPMAPVTTSPPVGALTLVSAVYAAGPTAALVLTFNRAIDVGAIDGWAILVDAGAIDGVRLVATGAVTMAGPAAVRLGREEIASASGPTTLLTAEASNGIVAAGDGAGWAGVTELLLPFP
jgi:hypothetical protein